MKTLLRVLTLSMLVCCSAFAVDSGAPAPDFTAKTSKKEDFTLSSHKGKVVVLEWLNYGCPFVKKHYDGKNMQKLQADMKALAKKDKKELVWVSVISSAKDKQGYSTPEQAEADRKAHNSNADFVVLDEDGKVGKLYGAETTPHMFVVDSEGKLSYQGAIDDKPSADKATLKGARSFVQEAVAATLQGKAPEKTLTKSYGCGVKYN